MVSAVVFVELWHTIGDSLLRLRSWVLRVTVWVHVAELERCFDSRTRLNGLLLLIKTDVHEDNYGFDVGQDVA